MASESKPVDPKKDEIIEQSSKAAGKQPAVESDNEDDDGQDEEVEATGEKDSTTTSSKKKKSKRKKIKDALTKKSSDPQADVQKAIASLPPDQLQELLKQNPALAQELSNTGVGASSSNANAQATLEALKKLSLQDIMTGLASSGKNAKDMASYKFWATQPVPSFDEKGKAGSLPEGPIRPQKLEDVPQEPPSLIEGFEWVTLDLTDREQLKEVCELLEGHYVEDAQAMFRFKYSLSILKWAMMSPGWTKDWHRGVRATQSRKLVAFISAIPLDIRCRTKTLHCSEVNFMVVHKKLRSKRLAPVLIKEITRVCNLKEVWQAIYTAGIVLPKPISTCRYYHRALNWQKLYEVGFSPLPPDSKPQFQVRKYALPDQTTTKGLRPMHANDLDAVFDLLTRYLARYDLVAEFTKEEMKHWLLYEKDPEDEQVVYCYVVEDNHKKITDFFSFYALDSTVINHPKHQVVHAAYLFYYATEAGLGPAVDRQSFQKRLNVLMNDTLILAKKENFDVFNATSVMDSALFLDELKYGAGDGQLHYYLFNYRANPVAGGVDQHNRLDKVGLSGVGFTML